MARSMSGREPASSSLRYLKLARLDPQVVGELRLVVADPLDELLGILAPKERLHAAKLPDGQDRQGRRYSHRQGRYCLRPTF